MDIFDEAAAELGCDTDELEGTFPPSFVRFLRSIGTQVVDLDEDES